MPGVRLVMQRGTLLSSPGITPLIWQIAAVTHCPQHGTPLQEQCPACGQPQPTLAWHKQPGVSAVSCPIRLAGTASDHGHCVALGDVGHRASRDAGRAAPAAPAVDPSSGQWICCRPSVPSHTRRNRPGWQPTWIVVRAHWRSGAWAVLSRRWCSGCRSRPCWSVACMPC